VTTTELLTTVDRSTEVNTDEETEPGKLAHIVPPDLGKDGKPERSGAAKVMEARVMGTPVTALCGWTWVPQQDPQNFPLCHRCKEIADTIRKDPGGMPRS
jgi:hypothetical protein